MTPAVIRARRMACNVARTRLFFALPSGMSGVFNAILLLSRIFSTHFVDAYRTPYWYASPRQAIALLSILAHHRAPSPTGGFGRAWHGSPCASVKRRYWGLIVSVIVPESVVIFAMWKCLLPLGQMKSLSTRTPSKS